MSKKSAVAIAIVAIAVLVAIIGLTMQATAYAIEGPDDGAGALGLAFTAAGFIALAAGSPLIISAIRVAAHDDAYLTFLADQQHNSRVVAQRAPVVPLDRRAAQ